MAEQIVKDLGTVKEGSKTRVEFPLPLEKEVKSVHAGCGCTNVGVTRKNLLKVVFKAKKFPKHLDRNWYTTAKYIKVTYTDNSVDIFIIKVKIVKKHG